MKEYQLIADFDAERAQIPEMVQRRINEEILGLIEINWDLKQNKLIWLKNGGLKQLLVK